MAGECCFPGRRCCTTFRQTKDMTTSIKKYLENRAYWILGQDAGNLPLTSCASSYLLHNGFRSIMIMALSALIPLTNCKHQKSADKKYCQGTLFQGKPRSLAWNASLPACCQILLMNILDTRKYLMVQVALVWEKAGYRAQKRSNVSETMVIL